MAVSAAVIDANVFYAMSLTDIIMQAARDGVIRARWTDAIHAEWINALIRNDPTRSRATIEKRRDAMDKAVPDALITGYEPLISTLTLPDPNDRHVLAAAIHGNCTIILTLNLKHFPATDLVPHGITAMHPDDFLLDCLSRDQDGMLAAVAAMRRRLKNPPFTVDEHFERIAKAGLPMLAAKLVALKAL